MSFGLPSRTLAVGAISVIDVGAEALQGWWPLSSFWTHVRRNGNVPGDSPTNDEYAASRSVSSIPPFVIASSLVTSSRPGGSGSNAMSLISWPLSVNGRPAPTVTGWVANRRASPDSFSGKPAAPKAGAAVTLGSHAGYGPGPRPGDDSEPEHHCDGGRCEANPGHEPSLSESRCGGKWIRVGRYDARHPSEEDPMAESVYRVTEVIGVSSESWEAAARAAVETAANTVRDLRIAEVVRQDLTIGDGGVVNFRVRLGDLVQVRRRGIARRAGRRARVARPS